MRAKVKVTVVDSGQEYLLLVSKMNLKGILVHTSQILAPNTQLILDLKLSEQVSTILKGYVHKVSENAGAKKGMIIAFSNPSEESRNKIQRFITDSKEISMDIKPEKPSAPATPIPIPKKKKKNRWLPGKNSQVQPIEVDYAPAEPAKKDPPRTIAEPAKTMIVGSKELPNLALSSPDNEKEIMFMSMDEESVQADNPGLSGSTRHIMLDEKSIRPIKSEKRAPTQPARGKIAYRAFAFVVVLIVLAVSAPTILRLLDKNFGQKVASPQGQPAALPDSSQTNSQTAAADSSGVLNEVQVDDQGSFLKISMLGTGNFSNNKMTKMTDPNRIRITFFDIGSSNAQSTASYTNDPLTKITTGKEDKAVFVDLHCAGAELPGYEGKVYPNGMDVFIYR